MKIDIKKQALTLHRQLAGKISITSKRKIKTKKDLSLLYTPGVGAVSAYLAKYPREISTYTIKRNTVAVVSDGSAVLGLGNIGPEGALPVMEGKAALFKEFAGVDAFPIVLATQDPDEIVATVCAIAPVFGGINLEDIAAPKCFEIERRLQTLLEIPVVHDDQHGTAMVVLAGLLNAFKVVKKDLSHARCVIVGSGAAGSAIAEILLEAGIPDIILVDSNSIVSRDRRDLDTHKKELAKKTNPRNLSGPIDCAIKHADVLIGVSRAGCITKDHIKAMDRSPIVFAMANPIPEIFPKDARAAGAAVIATGRSDFPNQINNVLVFPGLFRGALDHGVRHISLPVQLRVAQNLARLVSKITASRIIPSPFDRRVVKAVSSAVYL